MTWIVLQGLNHNSLTKSLYRIYPTVHTIPQVTMFNTPEELDGTGRKSLDEGPATS